MSVQQSFFRPALIGGLASGFLSAVPIIRAGNCICCLWVVVGGVLAAYFLSEQSQGQVSSGDGALVGLFSGVIGAAVVTAVHALTFPIFGVGGFMRGFDQMKRLPGMAPELERIADHLAGGGVFLLVLLAAMALVSAVIFSIFGTLGGLLGVAIFAKKQQTIAPPPPVPPSPPTA